MGQGLPIRVQIFTVFVALTGLALLGFLIAGDELCWGVLPGTVFFIIQIAITGSYLLPVAPRAKTDVSTAVLFGRAWGLEPGIAVVTAMAGELFFYLILKHLGDRLKLPGYQHPYYKYRFNLGEVAITTGGNSDNLSSWRLAQP